MDDDAPLALQVFEEQWELEQLQKEYEPYIFESKELEDGVTR